MANKKVKASLAKLPIRNPIAGNPLLAKSNVHDKSRKAQRQRNKANLKKEWYPQNTVENSALSIPFFLTGVPLQTAGVVYTDARLSLPMCGARL